MSESPERFVGETLWLRDNPPLTVVAAWVALPEPVLVVAEGYGTDPHQKRRLLLASEWEALRRAAEDGLKLR